jgi:hypothetical protein
VKRSLLNRRQHIQGRFGIVGIGPIMAEEGGQTNMSAGTLYAKQRGHVLTLRALVMAILRELTTNSRVFLNF